MPGPILLTYTLHPTQGPQREYLTDALTGIQAQLPLRNLHWKSSTRTALRTIQEVDVRLLELGEVGPQREVGGSILDGPLVNVCFIACDDAEIYKNSTRSFVRDWLSLLSARRNVHAPLIVLVNPPSAKDTGKNVFGRDKGILGKLKSDFNTGKRDRCVQVNLPSGNVADPAAWPEVTNKLKETIVSAFDAAILEREEEVKRGEAQRMTVGWNFCTWFLLKESLAYSFEGVNLHEDALIVYEELDATFLQILKEQNLSWFGKLGATGPQDDSLPILDARAKPYKEMLQSSSISIFDFRVYVFARQAVLLGRLGRITEVAKRGQWFVASLGRRLRENEGDLAEHFIESWTYTACIDIVTRCDEWSRIDRPNGDYSGLVAYESARSELLDIARVQVERIGVSAGHLPNAYPFLAPVGLITHTDDVLFESSDNGLSDDEQEDDTITLGRPALSNKQLVEAMSDVKKYRNLYLSMTKKALGAYEACGKANSVVRLKADLAALAMHTEEWQTAYDLSCALARDCADLLVWEPVSRFALENALRAHRELCLVKDAEWANIATAYMRVQCGSNEGRTIDDWPAGTWVDKKSELQSVISGLKSIEEEYMVHDHKLLEVSLLSNETGTPDWAFDVALLSMSLLSQLSEPFDVDEIRFIYESSTIGTVVFNTMATTLFPGSNPLDLTSETSATGVLELASAQIWIGQTCFSYSHLKNDSQLVMRRHPQAPSASLRTPQIIALDAEPSIVLRISSGSCELKNAIIDIQSMQEDVLFDVSRLSSSHPSVTVSDTVAGLSSLGQDETVDLVIPYRGTPSGEVAQARIVMRYESVAPMTYIDTQSVFTGLPLTVNVQDFFRGDNLISHFTIASDGREHLRVRSVELQASSGGDVLVDQARRDDAEIIVTPEQHLSCLFKIRKDGPPRSAAVASVLRLVIEYCNIDEEAEARLDNIAADALSPKRHGEIRRSLRDSRSWMPAYLATGKLTGFDVQGLEQLPSTRPELPWRKLEIPVDVPSRRLLAIARLSRISPSPSSMVFEGHALSLDLSLRTSFTWAGGAARRQRLVFDIVPNPDDWIILGRKKGFWDAEPDTAEQQQITLIPMRSGHLALPSITSTLLPSDPDSLESDASRRQRDDELLCETYLENAAEVVHVLPAKKVVRAFIPVGPAMTPAGAAMRDDWGLVA